MSDLISRLKTSFKEQFPKGYCNVGPFNSLTKDTIFLSIGLVGPLDDVTSNIRENDPMLHKFLIFTKDNTLSAELVCGRLCVKTTSKYYAMDSIKTGFRKTKGNEDKIVNMYTKWFAKLRTLVDEQGENIYKSDLYKDYI
jgi:hypothetical protein